MFKHFYKSLTIHMSYNSHVHEYNKKKNTLFRLYGILCLRQDIQHAFTYMQVVNHGIEHRTNITTFLASQGVQVPEIDNWGYMAAHADRFQMKEGKVGAE